MGGLGGGSVRFGGGGGQGGCERRIEVFVKIKKKIGGGDGRGGEGSVWGGGGGGQGGCDFLGKFTKKNIFLGGGGRVGGGGSVWWGGVRVDVNEELRFL